ncbi:MAG: proline--tRNA ligase [Chloroflexi bacterium]|nr:proline--tRNA ligase [Chloroflexota bacterium]
MRMTRLFSKTLREAPAEGGNLAYLLLLRAGFIRQVDTGIFVYLPLANRCLRRITSMMREELDAIGGQEITLPVVQPVGIWKESGRYFRLGGEAGKFKDKSDHEMMLAWDHEEVFVDLARGWIRSYRQLPALLFQIQTKWRDDLRPRGGLMRLREFSMLNSYSLDANRRGLEAQYQANFEAFLRIFSRCDLPVVAVGADRGASTKILELEFMFLSSNGDDELLFCDSCGHSVNRLVARGLKPIPSYEPLLPIQKIATPGTTSIAGLAEFLDIPSSRTAKAVFLTASVEDEKGALKSQFVFVVVRGDKEVNENKVAALLDATDIRAATVEEILSTGAVPGFASPVGLRDVLVIADDLIPVSPNLVAGANEIGFHFLNVNYGRDFTAKWVADITKAGEGDPCEKCGAPYRFARGIEIGHMQNTATAFTDKFNCTFINENGETQSVWMGTYAIGVERLLGCIAESHHDEKGLIWPKSVAPYPVHVVVLPGKTIDVGPIVEQLERELRDLGMEALVDDREESAGVKFNDADLIGIPLRITISERALKNGGVEFKYRKGGEAWIVSVENMMTEISKLSR